MRTCTADGTLLKPKAPAMNVDATFTAAAASWGGANNALGLAHIWAAPMAAATSAAATGPPGEVPAAAAADESADESSTAVPDHVVVLFANITAASGVSFGLADLAAASDGPGTAPAAGYLAREFYTGRVVQVNASAKLDVAKMTRPARCASAGCVAACFRVVVTGGI